MLTAIIVAGGSSQRMGFDKTFALLGGLPVVAHSIAAFAEAECVGAIVVVARADAIARLQALTSARSFRKEVAVVSGGAQRQDSVEQGLAKLPPETTFVAVHDAARPLITPEELTRVFETAREHGAAVLAAPVTDTLKRADSNGFVSASLEREGVYAMQTPQIFARQLLLEAYARVSADKLTITDEVSALQHLGHRVAVVANDKPNLKITFPADLALAELLLPRCRRAGD